MRTIDLNTWPRRQHLAFFNTFDFPHFNLRAPIDVSAFLPAVKRRGLSFGVATTYVLARAANAIPEFRQRLRAGQVVEHDVVHPSIIVPAPDELFSFCAIPYSEDFSAFAASAAAAISRAQEQAGLEDPPGRDDLLFMTAIPWVAFTGLQHPIRIHAVDSVPRIAWGRCSTEGGRTKMPLAVQAHHGLVDGLHAGRYFARVQELLDQGERFFGD